jgi:hypothetical protein
MTEIIWRTERGDLAGVTVHAPVPADDRVRLVIGLGPTLLRIPRTEARVIALALIDAADAPAEVAEPRPAARVIPIHTAPPAGLYHEPEEESCPNLPAA